MGMGFTTMKFGSGGGGRVVLLDGLSSTVLAKRIGNNLRVVTKYSPTEDICLDFRQQPANEIYGLTMATKYTNATSEPVAHEYGSSTGRTYLVDSFGDSVGPYDLGEYDSQVQDWCGGQHFSKVQASLSSTVAAKDQTAQTIELADGTSFPDPAAVGVTGYFQIGGYSYSYTGKTGDNVLTGVAVHQGMGAWSLINVGNTVYLVFKTATPGTPSYYADGVALADETWTECLELKAVEQNSLLLPSSLWDNPATPANWVQAILETVTYRFKSNGYMGVEYLANPKLTFPTVTYYGNQSRCSINKTYGDKDYMYTPFSSLANGTDIRANSAASDIIDDFENDILTDRFLQLNLDGSYIPTELQTAYVDVLTGTPSEYATRIASLTDYERLLYNTAKCYYMTVKNTQIDIDDVIYWWGSQQFCRNISTQDGVIAYITHHNGKQRLVLDVTKRTGETVPASIAIANTDLASKNLSVVSKDASLTITGQTGSTVATGSGGLKVAASDYGVAVLDFVPTFDPNTISGLALWLDASDLSTLTLSGAGVEAMKCKKSGKTLVKSTNAPTYNHLTRTISCLATGSQGLLGTDNFFTAEPFKSATKGLGQAFSMIVVVDNTSTAHPTITMGFGTSGTYTRAGIANNSVLPNTQVYTPGRVILNGTTNVQIHAISKPAAANPLRLLDTIDESSPFTIANCAPEPIYYRDSIKQSTFANGTNPTADGSALTTGRVHIGFAATFGNFAFKEIILYDNAISEANILLLIAYLKTKWGIA